MDLLPWPSRGLSRALGKALKGLNTIPQPSFSARGYPGSEGLPGSSVKHPGSCTLPARTLCLPGHTRVLSQTQVHSLLLLPLPCLLPRRGTQDESGMWECSQGLRVGGLCLLPEEHSEQGPVAAPETQTMSLPGSSWVSRACLICFPSSPQTEGRRQRGRSPGITDPSSC